MTPILHEGKSPQLLNILYDGGDICPLLRKGCHNLNGHPTRALTIWPSLSSITFSQHLHDHYESKVKRLHQSSARFLSLCQCLSAIITQEEVAGEYCKQQLRQQQEEEDTHCFENETAPIHISDEGLETTTRSPHSAPAFAIIVW
jgi:hypothetical protein